MVPARSWRRALVGSRRWGSGGGRCLLLMLLLLAWWGVDGRDAPELVNMAESDLIGAVTPAALAMLPITTPPDGTVFPLDIGDTLEFTVAAKTLQPGAVLFIVFEEPPALSTPIPSCASVPIAQRKATWCPPNNPAYACDCRPFTVLQYNSDPSLPPTALLDEEGNRFIVSSGAQIYRTYRGVVQRFASVDDLTLCFRALDCDPATANCVRDDDGGFDILWYPRRCLSIYVRQAPYIRSIAPVDVSMAAAPPVEVSEASPVPPWRPSSTLTSAKVPVGTVLELNVDAADPNEGDDVDIVAVSAMPAGAVLSRRMCCLQDWTECYPRDLGQGDCEEVCRVNCSTSEGPNMTVVSTCQRVCGQECVPMPCNHVRRTVKMMRLSPASAATLSFKAVDDSNRMTTSGGSRRANMESATRSVTVEVTDRAAGFIPPSPMPSPAQGMHSQSMGVIKAFVHCPMVPIAIGAYVTGTAWGDFTVLPSGCSANHYTYGGSSSGCLSPPCSLCPDSGLPEHMSLSPPGKMALTQRTFGEGSEGRGGRELVRAGWNITEVWSPPGQAQAVTMTYMHVVAASPLTEHARVVIRGIDASAPDSDEVMVTGRDGAAVAERGSWRREGGMLTVHVVQGHDSHSVGFQVNLVGVSSLANAQVMVLDEGGLGMYPNRTTGWMTLCERCYTEGTGAANGGGGTAYGLGPANWASESYLRWTPKMEHAGMTVPVCVKLFVMGSSVAAPELCLSIEVERCSYCTQAGESFDAIATAYGTRWTQIYAANSVPVRPPPESAALVFRGGAPDSVGPRTYIRLGAIYHAPQDMSLERAAGLFATSVEVLKAANPDLGDEDGATIHRGAPVCVLPGICDKDVPMTEFDRK